ncbi:MAG: response regulator, partial [Nitrospirales bacterium]
MVPIQHEILVVDDNPDILSLTRALLSEKGFKVRVANTGQGAVASCRLSPPDMVLLDLSLPDLSGYEVCSLLKEQVVTREIPVVFVSTSHGTIDKVKAFSLGAVDFITKPFHEPELLARINTHLTISQLQRRLQEFSQELEQRVDQQTQELSRV